MKKVSKLLSMTLTVAMVAAALTACGGSSSGSSGSGSTDASSSGGAQSSAGSAQTTEGEAAASASADGAVFKIGATGPTTGGAALYGTAVVNGAQIAVDEINENGGINGYQVEYNKQDDEHDAEKSVNAYNTLKDWGMQISTSSVTSKPAEATSVETYADRIFGLTPSASATAVTEGKDNVYQMCFIDPAQGTMSAQTIAAKGLASKIAVIWKNDDVYSQGIYETFVAEAAAQGLEIVSDTQFNDGNATDFSVQIADAQSKGAELVFLPMYYDAASLILNQAAAAGYAPKWFGVDGMDGILTLEGFDTALAETAGDKYSVSKLQHFRRVRTLQVLRLNRDYINPYIVGDSSMMECLDNAQICVLVLNIFSDESDFDLFRRIHVPVNDSCPVAQIRLIFIRETEIFQN